MNMVNTARLAPIVMCFNQAKSALIRASSALVLRTELCGYLAAAVHAAIRNNLENNNITNENRTT